jgi:putative ABC transport system permease protein
MEWQIIGVSRNIRNGGIRSDGFPEIDVPFWQSPWPFAGLAVRTTGNPADMTKTISAAVHSVDPTIPITEIRTMEQIVDQSLVEDRFTALLCSSFAAVALLLAAVGIYGVIAFTVARRTHEIGLRIALGASREHVLAMILKEGLFLAVLGLSLGMVGAYFVGRVMRGLLYGIGAFDIAAFSAVAVVLFVAALIACYVPAHRAAKVDPMVALRYE